MKRRLPPVARRVLLRLCSYGHEAYLVGGAVRDLLLGRVVRDVDVTTSALPQEVEVAFFDCRILKTGIRHGTQTVLFEDGTQAEITTFRTEGTYSDARHPDEVCYVKDVFLDLGRRDFTVGAMLMDAKGRLFDPLLGAADLAAGVLRAVGDPACRFREDALRILRALRLSAELGLVIEPATRDALRAASPRLRTVAKERLFSEFCRLLCAPDAARVLLSEREVLAVLVPELSPCFAFDQASSYHDSDVYTHIVRTVAAVEGELPLRLAAFYHDVGKPSVFSRDEAGRGHFYNHAEASEEIARRSLEAFGAPKALALEVLYLVRHHGAGLVPQPRAVRRALLRHGQARLSSLLKLARADTLAHDPSVVPARLEELCAFEKLLDETLSEKRAFSLRELAVGGEDLLALGLAPSPLVGEVLSRLLCAAAEGEVKNEREALLALAEKILESKK